MDNIVIKGAKQHNLKNIDLTLPRGKLIVFTGLSGSGKSSLAFDTIFAEGQRRYVESLSSYARQFLGQMDKPDVESIEGLSPAISIDQKTTSQNPRSTVGTVTEIYDYLRLMYARIGVPHCPECGKEIKSITIDQIVDRVLLMEEKTKFMVLSPIVRGRKGEYKKNFEQLRKSGYVRVKVDGSIYLLEEEIKLDKNIKHDISVVVDRLSIKPDVNRRLTDSIETALKLSGGLVIIEANGEEELFSTNYACPDCGISVGEITPRMFSFNAPVGACPACTGLGFKNEIDLDKLIPDQTKSLDDGAIKCTGWNLEAGAMAKMKFRALSRRYGFSMNTPYKDLPERIKNILLYGTGNDTIEYEANTRNFSMRFDGYYEGVVNNLSRRYKETQSDAARADIEKLMTATPCEKCKGKRLNNIVLGVTVGGINISDLCDLSVDKTCEFFDNLSLRARDRIVADSVLKEIKERLNFLRNVGLNYLTLSRASATLSGGEAQRIRLATQIGSGLTGVLYILDEPSIG